MSLPGLSGVNGHYNESFAAFIKRLIFRGKHAAEEVTFVIGGFLDIDIFSSISVEALLNQEGVASARDALYFKRL